MVPLVTLSRQSTEKAEAPGPLGLGCLVPDRAKCPGSGVGPWVFQGKWALSLFKQSPKNTYRFSPHLGTHTHNSATPTCSHPAHSFLPGLPTCNRTSTPSLSLSLGTKTQISYTPSLNCTHPTGSCPIGLSLPASKLPPDRYSATDVQTTTCPSS